MDRSSSRHALHELITLSWCALEQAQSGDGVIDDETYRFFTTLPAKPKQGAQHTPPEHEAPSMDLSPESQEPLSPSSQKRLEKLLPRPFTTTPADTSSTRKSISATPSMPHLSQVSLYQDPPSKPGAKRWAVFSYLPPATPPSPKELFISSVVTAISERLPVQVTMYSCYDPSFAIHLPVAIDDCEVILFFVDSHLKSALGSALESVQTFSPSSQAIEAPFTVLGSVHGRPLRALMLHTSTHEDPSIKGALWQSLKALATLTTPQ